MMLIVLVYLIMTFLMLRLYYSLRYPILLAIGVNSIFTFVHFFELDSPLIVSDSEYFMQQVKYFDQIPITYIILNINDYLFEFYSLIISILFRFSDDKIHLILSLHVVIYFMTLIYIIELIRLIGASKYERVVFTVIVTSFLSHYFVPMILRETPIVFCLVGFFHSLSKNKYGFMLSYAVILTLFHGGFIVLVLLSVMDIFITSNSVWRLYIILFVVPIFGFIYLNGVSIYKFSMNTEQMKDINYLTQQTVGGLGHTLDGSYRAERQLSSLGSYIYFLLESLFYFLFKPFFYQREAISFPLNFYKSTIASFLGILFLFNSLINTKFKKEFFYLFVVISVFAMSTSQYGQALRHFSKFFPVIVTYIVVDSYRGKFFNRKIVYGVLFFNIAFFFLYFIAVIV